MSKRKETVSRIVLDNGTSVTVSVRDGLMADDLVIQGMKAEGYRAITGRDVFPIVTRKLRDYLIRTGRILE